MGELIVFPAGPERDRIDEHFDEILAFIERNQARQIPGAKGRRPRPNTVASRRGKGLYPSPVGVAEFAGGEKIRMSFWQHAGRPWKFEPVQRWLCQIIGNERGRASPADAKGREDLQRKLQAARTLAASPGTAGEGAAAKRAMERLRKKAMEAVFDATGILTRVYPPATDCTSFHIEHDGKRIDLPAPSLPKAAKRRIDVSKNYDVTIKWHTEADATVRETVVKTWASSPKLADKIGLRGARLDGTVPKDAIINAPSVEPLRAVQPAESAAEAVAAETSADPVSPAIQIKNLDDLKRATGPGVVIKVLAHWQPELVGTTLAKMTAIPSYANGLRFNEDGSVTFYPKGRKSWTLAFSEAGAA
jgi:hypothetical protein